jgi:hypothetical protein
MADQVEAPVIGETVSGELRFRVNGIEVKAR